MKTNNRLISPIISNVLLIIFLFISDIQQTIMLSALLFVTLSYILKGDNYRKFLGICLLSIFPGIFSFIAIIYIMGGYGNYDFITFINSTYQSLIIVFIFAFVVI